MKVIGAIAVAAILSASAQAQPASREIAFVANAEGATVSLFEVATRKVVGEIDVNPAKATAVATGSPNFAQDTDVSPDGRTLYVARGYLGDVAAFDVASGRMLWNTPVDPRRADHMTISRDGKHLYVSAYTQNRARRLDTATGRITGEVATGVSPHDNQMSADGARLFNSSIGYIGTSALPAGQVRDPQPHVLTIADAQTLKVLDRIPFETGVRPWRFSPDEKTLYAQLSNLHGVIAYDLAGRKMLKKLDLPIGAGVTSADWQFDAPHHGLTITRDGRTLCLAGRASDYAALVRTPELSLIATVPVGDAPGWSEMADSDRVCLLANSKSDDLSVVSLAERKEIARVKMGDGPKHITLARVPADVLAGAAARSR